MPRRLVIAAVLAVALAATAVAQRVPDPVNGTDGDDRMVGTPRNDVLGGLKGDDLLLGRGGADFLSGNDGADVLLGGGGKDVLLGGRGPDRLNGGPGDDSIDAGPGARDVVVCGAGDDLVSAGARDAVAQDCESLQLTLPLGSASTPVTVEILGWASNARPREPGIVTAVPPGAVPSGGTIAGCPASDRRVSVYFRMHGIARRTATRTVLVFPAGPVVDLNSVRPRDEGVLFLYNFLRGPPNGPGRVENGPYAIRFQVEASGVYTTVAEATVTRACA